MARNLRAFSKALREEKTDERRSLTNCGGYSSLSPGWLAGPSQRDSNPLLVTKAFRRLGSLSLRGHPRSTKPSSDPLDSPSRLVADQDTIFSSRGATSTNSCGLATSEMPEFPHAATKNRLAAARHAAGTSCQTSFADALVGQPPDAQGLRVNGSQSHSQWTARAALCHLIVDNLKQAHARTFASGANHAALRVDSIVRRRICTVFSSPRRHHTLRRLVDACAFPNEIWSRRQESKRKGKEASTLQLFLVVVGQHGRVFVGRQMPVSAVGAT